MSVPACSMMPRNMSAPAVSTRKIRSNSKMCPLEETGRNSVSPCTMPRTAAFQISISHAPIACTEFNIFGTGANYGFL